MARTSCSIHDGLTTQAAIDACIRAMKEGSLRQDVHDSHVLERATEEASLMI